MTAHSELAIAALQPSVDAYERSKRPGTPIAAPGPLEVLAGEGEQVALDVDPQIRLEL